MGQCAPSHALVYALARSINLTGHVAGQSAMYNKTRRLASRASGFALASKAVPGWAQTRQCSRETRPAIGNWINMMLVKVASSCYC